MHRGESGDTSKQLIAKWPFYDKEAAVWKTITPVTAVDIDRFVADGVQQFKPAEYEMRAYSDKAVPLVAPGASWQPSPEWVESPPLACEQECLFWAPAGVSRIDIMFTTGHVSDSTVRLTVTAPDGKAVFNKTFPVDSPWQTLSIPTPVAGTYKVSIFDPKVTYAIRVPRNLPFVMKGGFLSTGLAPKVYFFVPRNLKQFVIYADGAIAFDLYDPNGARLDNKVNHFIVTETPAGMDGKVWALSGFKGWEPLRGINVPSLFALSPEGVMVPPELQLPVGKQK
jgi:hypothetical protein